jgi:hypothetical protein
MPALAPVDPLPPPPALVATAHRAIGDVSFALWTARNARGELCIGGASGGSKPSRFTCLRRGLERPLLELRGPDVILGLASSPVTRVSRETIFGSRSVSALRLHAVPGFRAWRAFEARLPGNPNSSTLIAYDATGAVVAQDGVASIGVAPVGETADSEAAVSAALALPAVRAIVSSRRTWLERPVRWFTCNGRRLGWILSFRFAMPASFTATLPVSGNPTGQFAYSTGVETIHASGWSELNVSLDTNVGAVVGVDSRPYVAEVPEGSTTTRATITPLQDAGGPDNPAPCSHD